MKIFIPLAGHSRRFRSAGYEKPKAFVSVGDKPMIQHVVEMFSANDEFYFIANSEQAEEFPELLERLKHLAPRTHLTIIPPHERGPVYSCLQVQGIGESDPVLINYCDFKMDWDYETFSKLCSESDGALAVFKGFHPASLGATYYAYTRCAGDNLLEIREKKSFTEDRQNEWASTGTYYFSSWSLFRRLGQEALSAHPDRECYASLLYNQMIEEGLNVRIAPVDRFICLGTPEDLAQYTLWWKTQAASRSPSLPTSLQSEANVVLMAGEGRRFQAEGYEERKPFVPVDGRPMIFRAIEGLPPAKQWIFMTLRDLSTGTNEWESALPGIRPQILELEQLTEGPADTCLAAQSLLDADASVLVTSCDYSVRVNAELLSERLSDPSVDALVWTTTLAGRIVRSVQDFAYCAVGADGRQIVRIVEKQALSDNPARDPLLLGTFWFRRAGHLFWAAEEAKRTSNRVNGEFYIGNSLNALVARGLRIEIFPVDLWTSFGTPVELRTYEFWKEHFACSK